MDLFQEIAAKGIGGRLELLAEKKPQEHKTRTCVLAPAGSEARQTGKERYASGEASPEALKRELKAMREKMASYLADCAPPLQPLSRKFPIERFLLDGEKEIQIPYYGGPVGPNKAVYEADFNLDIRRGKEYDICFEGADYYAVVYINGTCVGTHEGFFAPFSFRITDALQAGENHLKVELYNDYVFNGDIGGKYVELIEGDKLYAATGPGWDDPEMGWHDCPPGTGLHGKVYVEEHNEVHITDLYVRPMPQEQKAELWVEVDNVTYRSEKVKIKYSVFGQNFEHTVCRDRIFQPQTFVDGGSRSLSLPAKHGKNVYRVPVEIPDARLWEPDTPYLYQAQVWAVVGDEEQDARKCQFGMRSFTQDTEAQRKGMFYLNGRKIRLRGANTMGFEQWDVMRGDFGQLIDDILLAKLCNMNFFRLTQRPVQEEVYEYCDRLGLMTQTDLPLFGCMRRTKVCEGIRQAEEMERLVRKHPCNILITYINEPFANALDEPHRHLLRDELEVFFQVCDRVVKLQNPERVIKHADGDYDPPTEGMPDYHCYTLWYNGHGIDAGRLHRGYWIPVKEDWYYGCGEYGTEGLDYCDVMLECYPEEWLREPFDPANILRAQTAALHGFFYDTQDTMEDWVRESQEHQRFATRFMTEAFRRDDRMISTAIHLFIDAWPSGWMKTIMDCRRTPKPAYFACRDAFSPVLLSLRTDRFHCFAGEEIRVECFLCNDTNREDPDCHVAYELYRKGKLVMSGDMSARMQDCQAGYSSECVFVVDEVEGRETVTLKAILLDGTGEALCSNSLDLEVFQDVEIPQNDNVVILNPEVGIHEIAGETVEVRKGKSAHFVSRKTGHRCVSQFREKDFSFWYDQSLDRITPISDKTFTAPGFTPILLSGREAGSRWESACVCAEKRYEGKRYIVCTVDLRQEEPVAKLFLAELMK